jgi:hypothetical protein
MKPREIQDGAIQSERLVTLFPGHVKPLIGENPGCEGHRQQLSLAKIAIWLEISQMKVKRILTRHNCQLRS